MRGETNLQVVDGGVIKIISLYIWPPLPQIMMLPKHKSNTSLPGNAAIFYANFGNFNLHYLLTFYGDIFPPVLLILNVVFHPVVSTCLLVQAPFLKAKHEYPVSLTHSQEEKEDQSGLICSGQMDKSVILMDGAY